MSKASNRVSTLALIAVLAFGSSSGDRARADGGVVAGGDGTWSLIGSEGPARHTFASAYDGLRRQWILFGGSDGQSFRNETYVYSLAGGTWRLLSPAGPSPSPRRSAEGVHDPVADRFLIFGGVGESGFLGDVWSLDLSGTPRWSEITPPGPGPSPRAGHSLVYEPAGRRVILFGGFDPASPDASRRADVWALSLTGRPHWRQLRPAGRAPGPRSSHSAVYDGARRRMIVFGGTGPSFSNDVWALSLGAVPSWEPVVGAGDPPSPREEQAAVYDPVRDRLLVVGGDGDEQGTPLGDVWSLTLGGNGAWTRLQPSGEQPPPRWGHGAVYDPSLDRLVVHGGQYALYETWSLGF